MVVVAKVPPESSWRSAPTWILALRRHLAAPDSFDSHDPYWYIRCPLGRLMRRNLNRDPAATLLITLTLLLTHLIVITSKR